MTKKLSRFVIAISLVLTFGLSSIAGTGTITPPVYPRDYKKYQPTLDPTTAGNNTIPVWGHISLDTDVMPNPDPTKAPLADSKLINMEVPIQIVWAAFKDTVPIGTITSPSYQLINNDERAHIEVTMLSFKQVTGPGIDPLPVGSTVKLKFWALGIPAPLDLLAPENQGYIFPYIMEPGKWSAIRITGTYTGTYAAKAVNPKYEMVLKFAVKSIAP